MYIIIAYKLFSRALVSVNEFSFFLNIIINREKSRKIYPNKSHAFLVCVLSPSVVLWWFSSVTVFFFLHPSLSSCPTLYYLNYCASTAGHWRRVDDSSNSFIMQRTTSRSVLWIPLWCRTSLCRLVKPETLLDFYHSKGLVGQQDNTLLEKTVKRTDDLILA